jgi:tetratricopeptide (TPR) repeat protein
VRSIPLVASDANPAGALASVRDHASLQAPDDSRRLGQQGSRHAKLGIREARLSSLGTHAAVCAVLAGLLTSACATAPKKTIYSHGEIVSELQRRVSAGMRDQIVIPFEIDDDIRALAHRITDNLTDDRLKVEALVDAIIGMTQFSISYDWLSNKTAREVFREGRGNCLAYSNLLVGMAREVGLEAVYVDVKSVERQSREAEIIVNSGHVTAGLLQGPAALVVDFTRTPERQYLGAQVIDDLEAIANFYNNQGFLYGYFTETEGRPADFDPLARELDMYRLALEVKPTFSRARNNLGVALRRRGRVQEAIAEYKRAIEIDPRFPDAHSNLAAAYLQLGRSNDTVAELQIAAAESGSNGYFHSNLGVALHRLKRDDEAIKAFQKALSIEPGMASARYCLGEIYEGRGNLEKAIEEYTAALGIDPNNAPARARLDRLTLQAGNRNEASGLGARNRR